MSAEVRPSPGADEEEEEEEEEENESPSSVSPSPLTEGGNETQSSSSPSVSSSASPLPRLPERSLSASILRGISRVVPLPSARAAPRRKRKRSTRSSCACFEGPPERVFSARLFFVRRAVVLTVRLAAPNFFPLGRFRPSTAGCHVASSSRPHRGSSSYSSDDVPSLLSPSLSVCLMFSRSTSEEDEDEASMITGVSSSTRERSTNCTRRVGRRAGVPREGQATPPRAFPGSRAFFLFAGAPPRRGAESCAVGTCLSSPRPTGGVGRGKWNSSAHSNVPVTSGKRFGRDLRSSR